MRATLFIIALLISFALFGQTSVQRILSSIEENNTTLHTFKKEATAEKLGNKTGIYLSNPDVEFNYLWSSPTNLEKRNDLSIKQTFDIATITGMKSRMANNKNELVDLQYKSNRMTILLEAKQYCIDLIYYNSLMKELEIRLKHSQTIADGYKQRMKQGDVNVLEYNKIQLNLSTIQGEIARVEIERNSILSELKRLNGGIDVMLTDTTYEGTLLPNNFEEWYSYAEQKNPLLQYVRQQIETSKYEVKLNKAMGLPKFSAGYMSERTRQVNSQGLSVGISIPLWENKNRVKQAKANVIAAEARRDENKQQFYNKLRTLYMRASGLQETALAYRKSLATLNSTELLMKALKVGEISLLNYIIEIGLYYNTVNQALTSERDYQRALAELSAVEL